MKPAKLTTTQVQEIYHKWIVRRGTATKDAITRALAAEYGVSGEAIRQVLRRKTYAHLDLPEDWIPY